MRTSDLSRVTRSTGFISPVTGTVSIPTWYVAVGICALADAERHLGHAVHQGNEWLAYDAVHPNEACNGFLFVGRFKNMVEARLAIESSVGVNGRWWPEEIPQTKPY